MYLWYRSCMTSAVCSRAHQTCRQPPPLVSGPASVLGHINYTQLLSFSHSVQSETCLLSCVPPGGELLPRDESDRCHLAHVPEWRRCLLGSVSAPHRQQACHARWGDMRKTRLIVAGVNQWHLFIEKGLTLFAYMLPSIKTFQMLFLYDNHTPFMWCWCISSLF